MATDVAMAMRRVKAAEAQAKHLADLNRKMDLVMKHLGITFEPEVPTAEESPVDDDAKADEVPVETKAKKK